MSLINEGINLGMLKVKVEHLESNFKTLRSKKKALEDFWTKLFSSYIPRCPLCYKELKCTYIFFSIAKAEHEVIFTCPNCSIKFKGRALGLSYNRSLEELTFKIFTVEDIEK